MPRSSSSEAFNLLESMSCLNSLLSLWNQSKQPQLLLVKLQRQARYQLPREHYHQIRFVKVTQAWRAFELAGNVFVALGLYKNIEQTKGSDTTLSLNVVILPPLLDLTVPPT